MPIQNIKLNFNVNWMRPINRQKKPFCWGDGKNIRMCPDFGKRNLIYRWRRHSDGAIAYVGETGTTLSTRINNYQSGKTTGQAGKTNKKLFKEQMHLSKANDYLYLEYCDNVKGYNLTIKRDRKAAESLLIGILKPYLQL